MKVITGNSEIEFFVLPPTSQVTYMAHLLFKICLENICPRIGSRSNFDAQDVVVVALLSTGRKFDLADLTLKNMMEFYLLKMVLIYHMGCC